MTTLTRKQQQILDFIQKGAPTFQEIADQFGFRSLNSVTEHVRLLRQKGFLESEPGKWRSLRVTSPLAKLRNRIVDIPIYGSVPAGFADRREQEVKGCVSVDIETVGVKPSPLAYALEVEGDSMIGRHIAPGDLVIIEPRLNPKSGDVVVALIDGASTLKTLIIEKNGKTILRAENPKYPNLIPKEELVIEGVMLALIRKRK